MMIATASSTMPKPIVPISMRSKSLFSKGRRHALDDDTPMSPVTAIATAIASAKGSLADR
jgi:hypothetical protein